MVSYIHFETFVPYTFSKDSLNPRLRTYVVNVESVLLLPLDNIEFILTYLCFDFVLFDSLRPYSHEIFWQTTLQYCDKKILR